MDKDEIIKQAYGWYYPLLQNEMDDFVRWRAMIKIKDKSINLGSYATEEEASEAYQKAKNENP